MFGLNLGSLVQAILFFLFAGLTAILTAVIGPTYDQLLVPELAPSALYPTLSSGTGGSASYLTAASQFSTYTLANVVDPAIALVGVGVAVLYFSRVFVTRWAQTLDGLLPRLVIAVVVANFTVPIAGAVLDLGGGLYPVLAGWDDGVWEHWVNLAGEGQVVFSWDNGAVAFVLSLVEFVLVFALVLAVGLRDALLGVLLVLLPIFTLLWPFRPLSTLARRAWLLFGELVFLPCVLVIPLELAVGSPSAVLLVGYLACALSSPYLLSLAGTHLSAFGFPGSASTISSGTQRGLSAAPAGATGYAGPAATAFRNSGPIGQAVAGTARAAGSAAAPVAAPLAAAQIVGHGALHLVRHLQGSVDPSRSSGASTGKPTGRWPPIRGGGTG